MFGGTTKAEIAKAQMDVEAAKCELARIDALIVRYTDIVGSAQDVKPIVEKLRALIDSRGTAEKAVTLLTAAYEATVSGNESLNTNSAGIQQMAADKLDTPEARLKLREEIRRVVHRIDASFTKKGGHYMIVTYSNGAKRYLRPNKNGDGVQIQD